MDIKKFVEDFAKVLEMKANEINDNTLLHTGDGWDSINLMSTIALIDKHFNSTTEISALKDITKFGELKTMIETYIYPQFLREQIAFHEKNTMAVS